MVALFFVIAMLGPRCPEWLSFAFFYNSAGHYEETDPAIRGCEHMVDVTLNEAVALGQVFEQEALVVGPGMGVDAFFSDSYCESVDIPVRGVDFDVD